MKSADYLVASVQISCLNRTPAACGGVGEGWSLAWAVRGEEDAPDWSEIDEGDLPGEFDAWGLVVVTILYDDERAYAVGNRGASGEEVMAAMVDANGWRRR